jgi:hypothetical protein
MQHCGVPALFPLTITAALDRRGSKTYIRKGGMTTKPMRHVVGGLFFLFEELNLELIT